MKLRLDKIDFLNLFRLNKDNPNYVDKRTTEEKEIDENLDEYLREIKFLEYLV